MITYRLVKKFDKSFLDGYKRFSKTSEMYVLKNDCLVRTNTDFIDEWDQGKLESISEYFKELVGNGGYVMCAFDKKKVVGFMTIDSYHFNGYVHVPYVHIDREYRGKGIGKKAAFC